MIRILLDKADNVVTILEKVAFLALIILNDVNDTKNIHAYYSTFLGKSL